MNWKSDFILCCFLFLSIFISCKHETRVQVKDFSHLVPYRSGSLWGICDTEKHIIIPVKYDEGGIINDTMAEVQLKHRITFINVQGKEIFPFPYFEFDGFSEGMGLISEMKKFGFIDMSGKEIVAPKYDDATPFYHGVSKVKIGSNYGFIDKQGKEIIPVIHSYVDQYHEGTFKAISETKLAVYDTLGNIIIPFQSGAVDKFSDGLIRVFDSGTNCYKDMKGNTRFCSHYPECSSFVNGRAYAGTEEHYGLMDKNGKMITSPIFEEMRFSDSGPTLVMLEGLAGYLDSLGNPVIPLRYNFAEPFVYGFASVSMDDEKMALINRKGKILTPFNYDRLFISQPDVILFTKDHKMGLMDTSGHELTGAVYDQIQTSAYSEKIAAIGDLSKFYEPLDILIVEQNDKYGFMNKQGKELCAVKYDEVKPFSEGLAAVCLSNKWGYINTNGEVVIPLKYESAAKFKNGLARVGTSDHYGYINKRGVEFFDDNPQPPTH
ncbi:MAG TPA: WG repeat-containing protein [Chitinophagales bacterium]|nr:WG repeat-containing protein [Chitinophagales bacterium]